MQQNVIGQVLGSRVVVFVLAWLSFGCLLGQFYGLWTMHFFGCCNPDFVNKAVRSIADAGFGYAYHASPC